MPPRCIRRLVEVISTVAFTATLGCQSVTDPAVATHDTAALHWLEGCWISGSGEVEERWTRSLAGDQLFGFSVTRKEGARVFFEQLRIDRTAAGWDLFAYPRGQGPTQFIGALSAAREVTFRNDANDYPQRIVYRTTTTGLSGIISRADGSNVNQWTYVGCDSR